jgi:hypothetical protein
MKDHLLKLNGLTRQSTKTARFWDAQHNLIAEREVTADECFDVSRCPSYWSLHALAACRDAQELHAAAASWK